MTSQTKQKRMRSRNASDNGAPIPASALSESATPLPIPKSSNGLTAFSWLIRPANVDEFQARFWQKRPLHIRRNIADRSIAQSYRRLFSFDTLINHIRRRQTLQFGTDLNICKFVGGRKIILNPSSTAQVSAQTMSRYVETAFNDNGATIQAHHPQHYHHVVAYICSALESYFHSAVGCNAYLTPANSQGLAPHYDDVDVFIMQTEGTKQWRIYAPIIKHPLQHSGDLSHDVIGQPIQTITMKVGDVLYLPRGYIHEAMVNDSSSTQHSTHLTFSTYQSQTYIELLRITMNNALDQMSTNNKIIRQSWPINLLERFGTHQTLLVHNPAKKEFEYKKTDMIAIHKTFQSTTNNRLHSLFMRLHSYFDIDSTADIVAADFYLQRLPPVKRPTLASLDNDDFDTPVQTMADQSFDDIDWTQCKVRWQNLDHIRISVTNEDAPTNDSDSENEEDDDDDNDDDETDEKTVDSIGHNGTDVDADNTSETSEVGSPHILLVHSLHNRCAHHLDGRFKPPKTSQIHLPLVYLIPLNQLTESYPVCIRADKLPIALVVKLWQLRLIRVIASQYEEEEITSKHSTRDNNSQSSRIERPKKKQKK